MSSHVAQHIGILAGHDARFYELRIYGGEDNEYEIVRVKREGFLEAMAGIGLNGLDGGGPE